MVGAYAGNRLGAVRDAKGKAVAAVFAELGNEQKAEVNHGSLFRDMHIVANRYLADHQSLGHEDIRSQRHHLTVHQFTPLRSLLGASLEYTIRSISVVVLYCLSSWAQSWIDCKILYSPLGCIYV